MFLFLLKDRLRAERIEDACNLNTELLIEIMSLITDTAAATAAQFERIHTGLTGIQGDLGRLKAEIEELKNSGTITPEDRSALESILALATGAADRVTAVDAETVPPVTPEEPQP